MNCGCRIVQPKWPIKSEEDWVVPYIKFCPIHAAANSLKIQRDELLNMIQTILNVTGFPPAMLSDYLLIKKSVNETNKAIAEAEKDAANAENKRVFGVGLEKEAE